MVNRWDGNMDKYINEVKSLNLNSKRLKNDFVDIVGKAIIDIMKRTTPKTSGDLANSWVIMEKSDKHVVVGTTMHDSFLQIIHGMKPRTIRARNAKSLFFTIGGQDFFRLEVFHPGSRANPYIEPIITGLDKVIQQLLEDLILKYWKIFGSNKNPKVRFFNASRTVGISTGTKRNTRRGRGGAGSMVIRSGKKSFKRKLGRRRRTGQFITTKKAKAG